jgi:histidinol-phosphate aminotransferase
MDIEKLVNPGTCSITPYEPGKSVSQAERETPGIDFIKLASNENPLGPSPLALKAIRENAHLGSVYPEVSCAALRAALSGKYNLPEDMFIVGNGADGVIYTLGMALIDQDDEAVIPWITFPYYEIVVKTMRGRVVYSGMREYEIDLDDVLAKITPKTKLVWISNPNNPTGSMIAGPRFMRFYEQVPPNVFVVHDEVYADFAAQGELPDTMGLLRQGRSNLILLRSFSKIYGLAGMRLGFGMAQPELIRIMYKVRPPFDVSTLAEKAGCAALEDREFYERTLELTRQGKDYLYKELKDLGLRFLPSQTNFVIIDMQRECRKIQRSLLELGVIVRPADSYRMPTCIRVTVGTPEQNRRFMQALKQVSGS